MRTTDVHKFEKQRFAISNYFRELRYAENLSQAEVGIETGLHRNTILNIENSKNFEIMTFFALCEFYQISGSELLSIIEE
jgi:transcriptional regulator with XRE-family HTH domain